MVVYFGVSSSSLEIHRSWSKQTCTEMFKTFLQCLDVAETLAIMSLVMESQRPGSQGGKAACCYHATVSSSLTPVSSFASDAFAKRAPEVDNGGVTLIGKGAAL